MKIQIKRNITGEVLYETEANSLKRAVELAISVNAYLSYADLSGADLRDADLRDADLSGADLRDADLRDADLRKDAERYRWLRNECRDADIVAALWWLGQDVGIDVAIDAAMEEEGK